MANYPSFELIGSEQQYLRSVPITRVWRISSMPDKLYLHTGNGELVAIRPKFFAVVKYTSSINHSVFGFDMAGEGARVLRVDPFQRQPILFESPGDFERYRTTEQGAYQPDFVSLAEILKVEGYETDANRLRLWYDKKGIPTTSSLYHGFRIWLDREGAHADHDSHDTTYGTLYKTREECAAALAKAKVVDFEEEEQEFIVSLPKTVAVTARNAEEAEQKVQDGLKSIIN